MPTKIKNKSIIKLLDDNAAELKKINQQQEKLNKRIDSLSKKNTEFVRLMDDCYGWGNWQNVDAINHTFMSREEIEKGWYVIQNPALKPRVEVSDIITKESNNERIVCNDPKLSQELDKLLMEQENEKSTSGI